MSGYDLARVKQIERENGRLKDIISDLRRDLDRYKRDPDIIRRQAINEGERVPAKAYANHTPDPAARPPVGIATYNRKDGLPPQVDGLPRMTKAELRIYHALAAVCPQTLSLHHLLDNCTGGKVVTENAMRASLMRLRNKLKLTAWEIICYHGTGYALRSSR